MISESCRCAGVMLSAVTPVTTALDSGPTWQQHNTRAQVNKPAAYQIGRIQLTDAGGTTIDMARERSSTMVGRTRLPAASNPLGQRKSEDKSHADH